MSLRLYMDVHIHGAITTGLRLRGIDVLRAQDDGAGTLEDARLLDRATSLDRILFTNDEDLLKEGAFRQHTGKAFAGLVYANKLRVTIGQCIHELELICGVYESQDMASRVERLPLGR